MAEEPINQENEGLKREPGIDEIYDENLMAKDEKIVRQQFNGIIRSRDPEAAEREHATSLEQRYRENKTAYAQFYAQAEEYARNHPRFPIPEDLYKKFEKARLETSRFAYAINLFSKLKAKHDKRIR